MLPAASVAAFPPDIQQRLHFRHQAAQVVERCAKHAYQLFSACGGRGIFLDFPLYRFMPLRIHAHPLRYYLELPLARIAELRQTLSAGAKEPPATLAALREHAAVVDETQAVEAEVSAAAPATSARAR